MKLSRSFGAGSTSIRSQYPLADEQIMRVAPSVFAEDKHESRSSRYAYIPTIEVLNGLRREGFQPFFAVQSRCRDEGKREFTKHMLRLRHASQIDAAEANEIILLNSHDGTSSYQMVAGMLRFVCQNGLVAGDIVEDFKARHSGDVVGNVIEGAFTVLDQFGQVAEHRDAMRGLTLSTDAQRAFARAALELRWEPETDEETGLAVPPPITAMQALQPRRIVDAQDHSLWGTFNRVQENLIKGGQAGHTANGKRRSTRAVTGIAQDVKLNRALWTLAEEMRKLVAPVAV